MAHYPSSTCPINGSARSTLSFDGNSSSKFEFSDLNKDKAHPRSSLTSTSLDQQELSTSRITDYLRDPTTSHVEPQHVSAHASLQILSEKKSHIKALEEVLNNNEK
ncbi:hypothetical protein NA56DRAFT_641793 [Hyaloscypha hepaticicola]|uniref:Uncharacterized protein n=1 Tax=Hyaloscypha hepaticicola TaxID=2082293 RepID=A0A2J6QJ62_9HELO|nr:hypothetical protein NA56DRAFT_641793 [Hyaloscypha hepaticicola]